MRPILGKLVLSFTFTYHTLVAMCVGYWLSDKRLFTTKMMLFHTLGKCLTQHLVQDINKMCTYIDLYIIWRIKHISYYLLKAYCCSYYYLIIYKFVNLSILHRSKKRCIWQKVWRTENCAIRFWWVSFEYLHYKRCVLKTS